MNNNDENKFQYESEDLNHWNSFKKNLPELANEELPSSFTENVMDEVNSLPLLAKPKKWLLPSVGLASAVVATVLCALLIIPNNQVDVSTDMLLFAGLPDSDYIWVMQDTTSEMRSLLDI